jgi:transposase InsO family protein
MALIQFKLNNYDFSDDVIDKVKAYIQTNNYPTNIITNYKKKLYDNKWKGFILKDNALFYEPEKLFVIKNDDKESILKQEYSSPNSAGLGYRQFYYLIASKYLNIKRKDVQDFLNRQPTYQITRQSSHFINKPILAKHCNERWSIDLIDLNRYKGNAGFRYILTCIDYFSRYCWIRPLKDKTSLNVKEQMEDIISTANTRPKILQSDNGKEFRGSLSEYCENKNIKQVFTLSYTPQSNGLVENLNNQVRKILREMFLRNKNTTWYDKLEIVAINKNNQRNSSIKNAPVNVWHPGYDVRDNTSELLIKEKAKKRIEKYKATEYKIGDLVRVKVSALFSKVRELIKNSNKKYLSGKYTPEVYRVKSILMPDNEGYENNRYTIETLNGILLQTQLKKKQYKCC